MIHVLPLMNFLLFPSLIQIQTNILWVWPFQTSQYLIGQFNELKYLDDLSN